MWAVSEGNWRKSHGVMCAELGVPQARIRYLEYKWPQLWLFVNTIIRKYAANQVGRVVSSMADAAVYGDDKDKRLYLEFFGLIKRESHQDNTKTIVFVNDQLNRPGIRPNLTSGDGDRAVDVEVIEENSGAEV